MREAALGQLLKERRVVLGMDLEDVERRTKIRTRYLEALETGDWDVLPGEVYARGFVRSYAECVGLDGLELLERYIDGPNAEALTNRGRGRSDNSRAADSSTSNAYGPQKQSDNVTSPNRTTSSRSIPSSQEAPEAGAEQNPSSPSQGPVRRAGDDDDGVPYLPPSVWANNRRSTDSPNGKASQSSNRRSPQSSSNRRAPEAPIPRVKNIPKDRRPFRVSSIVGQGVAVLAAFAVLVAAWWWLTGPHHGAKAPLAGNNVAQNTAANGQGQNVAATGNQMALGGTNSVGSTTANAAANQAGGAATNNAAANQSANSAASSTTLNPQPYDSASGVLTVLASTSGPIAIEATSQGGKCWIQVSADGKNVDPNDFIVPGKTKSFQASKELKIELGNVPVVSMTINGQPLSLPNVSKPIWVDIKKQ